MRHWLGISIAACLLITIVTTVAMQRQQTSPPTSSLSPFLPSPLDTQVFGQTRWLAKTPVALKVVTIDRQRQQPVSALVQASLRSDRVVDTFSQRTNANGVADLLLRAPDQPGTYTLRLWVQSAIGNDQVEVPITVEEVGQILLTTDKPIYQPAQTIHIRALCLRKPDLHPIVNASCVFEVRDPKGNLVFRTTERTSRFGIAATEFPIADEVTIGEYRITATVYGAEDAGRGTENKGQKIGQNGERETQQTLEGKHNPPQPSGGASHPLAVAERTVRVERYVLPKFKVTVETDKRFYLPAETLRGTITAVYFFGKPVSNGEVVVRLSTFAAGWHDLAELKGTLNQQGTWQFETRLPEKFVGLPLEGGKALLRVEATVTDKADHSERTAVTLPVSSQPIQIAVVPESPNLKPNLPVRLFVVTTYPDGTPAQCRFTIRGKVAGETSTQFADSGITDTTGIGEAMVTAKLPAWVREQQRVGGFGAPPRFARPALLPVSADDSEPTVPLEVTVSVTDEKGHRAEATHSLSLAATEESVLLRVSKSVAKVGETLVLDILTSSPVPRPSAPVFVDAIVNRQTVLTKTVEVQKGRGTLSLPLTPDLTGTLVLHAYRITAGGDIVRDTKVVIVEPANALAIKVTADKDTYRPGDQAQLRFRVADQSGRPTVAALGITVVDESVFALTEMQPGLERLYFALERELLTPRYEVHGWELQPVLLRREEERTGSEITRTQRMAQVLLAAAAPTALHTLRVSTYERKQQEVNERWQKFLEDAAVRIRKALEAYRQAKGRYPLPDEALRELVAERLLTERDIRDPLGNPYQLQALDNFRFGFRLISAGLDGKFETDDDFIVFATGQGRGQQVRGIRRRDMVFTDGVALLGAAPAGPMVARALPLAEGLAKEAAPASASPEEVRVRQFFPETLFVQPQLITNERGEGQLTVPLADSITTWRLTALGSSATGLLGSTTFPLRVFQDFFVDIDLPVAFTQGDEVAMPVALYNYLAKSQTVRLRLEVGSGFEVLDEREKTVRLQPNEVTAVRFRLRASQIGSHPITVYAYGDAMSDAIKRTATVLPDGKEMWRTISDQLMGRGAKDGERVERTIAVNIPREAIDGAHKLLVRVYAGAFSQVLDGLENLLRMPFGCFEQTSSVSYPNVLVLRYLKRTGKAQPETEMKARHFITIGYQRLLTFEVPGGGFSWFGDPPANKVLTAYGLLQFSDMSRVHDVDPALLVRTIQWLISKQNPDGSWEPDKGGIAEGAINRQTDFLRTTAYIAWAISEATQVLRNEEQAKPALQKAISYLTKHGHKADEAYALALVLNAAISAKAVGVAVDANFVDRVARELVGMVKESDEIAFWESKAPTPFFGRGTSGDLETTALATYALIHHGGFAPLVGKALTYLVRNKDAFGTWQTTQATIWALKSFLAVSERGAGVAEGTLTVRVNGEPVAEWHVTTDNADIVRMVDATKVVKEGKNEVTLSFSGKGSLLYQVSARFYLPWDLVPPERDEPLQVQVNYDRTELLTNEIVTCQVRVTNRRPMAAQMVIVDIGIPPGFEVMRDDLVALVEKKVLQRFELTPRQVICYLDRINGGATVGWQFRLRAKMPVRAKTGRTTAYEYYAPQETSVSAPIRLIAH